jgi:CubicO group peptidase (beta-lactamase class C family)
MAAGVLCAAWAALALAGATAQLGAQDTVDLERLVEQAAARRIPPSGPGCAIGVNRAGRAVTTAFGAADMERGVPLTGTSVLEAGSVSKQFTAAAVILLALDGKFTLDDDVRRYFPELPAYGSTVTIRHLLTHTSGLRDWGAIASMEGWPRTTREYTNAHVLDIAARQRALNHQPGAAYSYTNTGYNLLALLVERVSGKTLAEFTRERLFLPLGMQNTSWRDDHTRIVVGRALAYSGGRGAYSTAMPNENAHGNGGLLTTVRDLLVWNEAMDRGVLGKAFGDSVVKRFVLASGRTIDYALGVNVVSNRGTPEINHSGSTGGYRAYLVRFPEAKVSVAVLCNGAGLNATAIAYDIAGGLIRFTGSASTSDVARRPFGDTLRVARFAGVWVHEARHTPMTLTDSGNTLRNGNAVLQPIDANAFVAPGARYVFSAVRAGQPTALVVIAGGDSVRFRRSQAWRPDAAALAAFAGTYATDEVHGEPFRVAVEGNQLVARQTPSTRIALTPVYTDAFQAGSRIVWFTRDPNGRVTTMSIGVDRAWAVAFPRQ